MGSGEGEPPCLLAVPLASLLYPCAPSTPPSVPVPSSIPTMTSSCPAGPFLSFLRGPCALPQITTRVCYLNKMQDSFMTETENGVVG